MGCTPNPPDLVWTGKQTVQGVGKLHRREILIGSEIPMGEAVWNCLHSISPAAVESLMHTRSWSGVGWLAGGKRLTSFSASTGMPGFLKTSSEGKLQAVLSKLGLTEYLDLGSHVHPVPNPWEENGRESWKEFYQRWGRNYTVLTWSAIPTAKHCMAWTQSGADQEKGCAGF